MQISSILRGLLFILICLVSSVGYSQLSKKHYIPPLTSGDSNANPEDQYIYISTPTNSLVPYTITEVGGTTITGTVSNATPQVINIGNGYDTQLFQNYDDSSTITNNKGYTIEADAPIYVSVRMNAGGAQAGALVSKGLSALDTTFRIGTFTSSNASANYVSFVSVMATEDNTSITFSNLPAGLIIENYSGTTPININLNENESYVIAIKGDINTSALMTGLIGCLVNSDKPIVVNCGSANGSFHNGNGRDYGIDQIAGLSKIGDEYIFVKGDGSNNWENVLVVAHVDNTAISINGTPSGVTLNAGEYHVIEGNNYSTASNMYVETSQDVFMYQGVGSSSEANQGMFFVPPLSCETRGNIDNIANIDRIGSLFYSGGVTIVTKTNATVTINNQPLSNFATVGPSAVIGNTDYETYRITGLTGNVSVQGDDELYVAYFNVNGAATSGSFYSGFPSRPEINFDAQFATLGNCIPNITLEAANTQNFDSYEWWFDDGSGFNIISSNVPSITPTTPGKYKLIGVITCTLERLESAEVPVSICPDDIDNDGIIDNIDIDNDNDGILNCVESLGNVVVDLTGINQNGSNNAHQLLFQDGSINTLITSGVYTKSSSSGNTNDFFGDNQGNFQSTIGNSINAENDYSLSFTEPVNVKFSEHATITHNPTDGESFIVRIIPNNKNITLIDPDDRLLIDSNFDGIFESGITQISGSEIHFRINPTPTGNIPYDFFANSVDGFSFIHRLSNDIIPSVFSANISLTCFKKDNDNDGIKDELDLDSDNDGIPDFIENDGILAALSGVDTDTNGLDDIYNINALPIDSDNDGVYDFYDLDSDNDGIYDLVETGIVGTIQDNNSDGVEDGPNFGVNGWADAAETTPDSNLIGYTPNDEDGDTIFSYLDLDSDGDTCSDVIEAGFSDGNTDDLLGDNPVITDSNGLVTNATDGYTTPDADYLITGPITITTQPVNTTVCELGTGLITIVSAEAEIYQWETSSDGINWTTLSDDMTYSGTTTSDLTITNVPLSFNNYQYRVFLNRSGNTCGLYSDEITLTVDVLPVANTASNMLLCDDDNNGEMTFDLTLQDNYINTNPAFTITYYTSLTNAESGTGAITSIFTGNTTIWARVENNVNTSCYDISSFDLEVYESPFPLLDVPPIQECDNLSDGDDTNGLKVFDLTQRETDILNGQDPANFSLTYFTDSGYTNQIPTPNSFSNTLPSSQRIYVRMTNNTNNACFADTSFEVQVFSLPLANTPNEYSQCDDETNDELAFFNLELDWIKEEINPNYSSEGLTFTFYEDPNEANTSGVEIPNPGTYQNTTLGFASQFLWVRVENPNGCHRVVPLSIRVSPYSGALDNYNPAPIYQCDDGIDNRDGVALFNLRGIETDILNNPAFTSINISVDFYESRSDAELEVNKIPDIENHENTNSPNVQSIWVRVRSVIYNDCLGLHDLTNLLIVEDLPVANPVTLERQCDYDVTDSQVSFPFDTSLVESTILNGQSLSNVTVTYEYLDINGSMMTTNTLPNPFLTESQTITITVTNNITQDPDGPCFDQTTLEFTVDEQPVIAAIVPSQEFCDGDAGDIDDDGYYPFDTSNFAATILGTQSNMEISFNYIDENGISITNSPTLPNPLTSANQTISVVVTNPINTNCFASTNIDLIVNPLPEFFIDSEHIVCTSDPTFTVTLDPVEANFTETFSYEWRWTSLDGSTVNQLLSETTPTIEVSTPGIYHVTLTKTYGTGCSRTKDIFVNASEKATISSEDVTIIDFTENNNSVSIDTTNLGQGNYEYALVEEDSNFRVYQDSPDFRNVRPGFYTIYVNDKDGCGTTTLDISVLGYMKFFTPNNDSYYDTWKIIGVNETFQTNSRILIFDRYGKLLKQISSLQDGWDGTSRGTVMPTDDYWFKVFLEDGRVYTGHFTLKR